MPPALSHVVATWSEYYGAHRAASVGVIYLHLAGLVVGGGAALAADRHVFQAAGRGPEARAAALVALSETHRVVIPAFAVVVVSGILMAAADLSTFLSSPLFWSKMGTVVLLLLNGTGLLAAERALASGRSQSWTRLRLASGASILLWLVILLLGVWLTAAA